MQNPALASNRIEHRRWFGGLVLAGTFLMLSTSGLISGCRQREAAIGVKVGALPVPLPPHEPISPDIETDPPEFIQTEPLSLNEVMQPGDRILFIGDELTQQMFYTRAVAAALLAIMPDADLRFFNGGFDGATTTSAATWVEPLLQLVKPTVACICLGLNDARAELEQKALIDRYGRSLGDLIDLVRSSGDPPVTRVIVMSPPAVEHPSSNAILRKLAKSAQRTAKEKETAFVDLFVPIQRVYTATRRLGERLTYDGRLPTESGHVILASVVLYGIGVTTDQLDPIGWSPLPPLKMRRVRPSLGLKLAPAPLTKAQRSRDLYESMLTLDQWFFRAWRLGRKNPDGPTRTHAITEAERAWNKVRLIVAEYL